MRMAMRESDAKSRIEFMSDVGETMRTSVTESNTNSRIASVSSIGQTARIPTRESIAKVPEYYT